MTPDAGYLLPAIRATTWVVFLGLWLLISIRDIRVKKILHRDLRWGLAIAGVAYSLMLLSTVFGHWGWLSVYYRWEFYGDLLVYVLTSTVVALAMWQIRIWPAGDAKLFAFLALVFPMLSISGSFRSGWLFLDVLVNIFFPASFAVFAHAARYIWNSRIQHARAFVAQMGLRREADYLRGRAREIAALAAASARAALSDAAARPREASILVLTRGGQWVYSMFVMALISCGITAFFPMPLLRTLVCFGLFMSYQKYQSRVDRGWILLFAAALTAILLLRGDPAAFGREFARSFGYLSVFSMFIGMGMSMSMGAMNGQLVMMLGIPLVGFLVGALSWGAGQAAEWLRLLGPLALLGLFFGLSVVIVRIWDDEEHPDIPLDKLLTTMVLHDSFHKLMSEDREFYENHFASRYADGITADQVEAVKAWCAERGIETVPLTTTISFAHWIFLGYFLTFALGGSLLRFF